MRAALARGPLLVVSFVVACGTSDNGRTAGDAAPSGNATTDGSISSPDATVRDAAAEIASPPPPCGTDAWSTYGHDARRSFATDACTKGPLTAMWHYQPAPPTGRTFETAFHAIAQTDGVFLQWMASDSPYTGTTAADRVSPSGTRVWTFDTGTDSNFGNWLTRWNDVVILNDDGVYLLDAATGMKKSSTGVDWWGQTIGDPARLYLANMLQADGPGLFVGAVDATTKLLWQQNLHQECGHGWGDVVGGLALDGGLLFYAPSYRSGTGETLTFPSGVFAFDAAAGTPKWSVTTVTPSSALSAGSGRIYLVEGANLVARSELDGTQAWSAPLVAPGGQAPVLADGKAIVATSAGVLAFDAATGAPSWTAGTVMAQAPLSTSAITNGCGKTIAVGGAIRTTMAASLASDTLVVTAFDGLHLLSLSTGAESWKGTLDGGSADLHDPIPMGHLVYAIDSTGLVALEGL